MAGEFVQHLVQSGDLEEKQVEKLENKAEAEDTTVEGLILDEGIMEERDLFEKKSDFLNIPIKRVYPNKIPNRILRTISRKAAEHYKMIPINKEGNTLEVGMINPHDFSSRAALDFIARENNLEIERFLLLPSDFEAIIRKYRSLGKEIEAAVQELEEEREKGKGVEERGGKEEKVREKAPISKIVSVILRRGVEGRASDIHIEPFAKRVRVRFRVDGVLYSSLFFEKNMLPSMISRVKVLSDLRIDETRIPQDGRFHTKIAGRTIDFRVATFPTSEGEKVALRVLDPKNAIKEMSKLGLEGKNLRRLQESKDLPFGSMVFCGPTGCGKTTTQYAILRELNTEKVNIVSLENPVEYQIKGINQSQVKPEIGYDFASGLRQVVRQDPDIIMVGEVRDRETASLVTHAALTGHLVLFTLHTNDAVGSIPRLIDLGVEKFLVPATIKTMVSQRLVRKLCPYCKEKVKANKDEEDRIKEQVSKFSKEQRKNIEVPEPLYIYKPKGCPNCNNSGFKGRIGIFETLIMTENLENIILSQPSEESIREEARRQKMVTLEMDGILKVLEGTVALGEVIKTVQIKENVGEEEPEAAPQGKSEKPEEKKEKREEQ